MHNRSHQALGHLCAIFAAFNWGFTFILTSILMDAGLSAFEALLFRSCVAYLFLWIICPRLPKLNISKGLRQFIKKEWPFIVAGLSGLSIYFLLDYSALNFTSASFVTILAGTVPLFMAIALWIVYKEPPKKLFILGFVIAVSGVTLVSTAGGQGLNVSLIGTALVLTGNVLWAVYSIMLRKIDESGETTGKGQPIGISQALLNLRRIFFWGLVSLLVCMPFFGFDVSGVNLISLNVLGPTLILGVMTSALTFLAYSLSIRWLGVSRASVYQYFPPAVGAVAAHFLLGETISFLGAIGIGIIIIGLLLSERVSGSGSVEHPVAGEDT
ncbi:MAG: DMT family transporter [Coriobacteriales bacterium]|jgi:drug/metabolite transporter (DMT)-like permease|nr:DMT family transporter [Coriobacteriales bacterium]